MPEELADRKCLPCNGQTPPVPDAERPRLLAELKGWAIEENVLTRTVKLSDFVSAVELVNRITRVAEEAGHHPDLHVSYGKVRIDLATHAIQDLSDNDFILAAKINPLIDRHLAGR
jgi:4a-hydroxytetrahydrobiopterin dehydratase